MSVRLQELIDAVREAGLAAVQVRQDGLNVTRKSNNDVLTQADLLANQILKSRLHDSYPEYGWLSEESHDDAERLKCDRVWVVDPIDGTREYVAGIPEYAVSVALVERGVGLMSVVYNPETNEMFTAVRGEGAALNGKAVRCRESCSETLSLLASRSESKRGEWVGFQSEDVKPVGSIAYKLGLVAAGLADATFSLGPKSEWDIAAGVLLVSEAGGIVTNAFWDRIVFNQLDVIVNGVIASTSAAHNRLKQLITTVRA